MSSFEWADDSLSQIQIHFDLVLKSNVNFISFSIKTNLVYAKRKEWESIGGKAEVDVAEHHVERELWPICVLLVSIYLTCDSTYHPVSIDFHIFLCVFHKGAPRINIYAFDPFFGLTQKRQIRFRNSISFLFVFNEPLSFMFMTSWEWCQSQNGIKSLALIPVMLLIKSACKTRTPNN